MTEENKEKENIADSPSGERKAKMLDCGKILPIAVIIGALIIAGAYFFVNRNDLLNKCGGKAISEKDAGPRAVKFINDTFFSGNENATLKGIKESNCVYQVTIEIDKKEWDVYMTRDGELLFPEGRKIETKTPDSVKKTTIGQFQVNDESVCKDGDKPIVYFFGSTTCPHCAWEKPVIAEAMKRFGNTITYKELIDSQVDGDVFSRYSDGSVPTIVLGCKYSRVGSGESVGEDVEATNLTAITCKLTNGQPLSVCDPIKDLVGQVTE